ncbi:MAG: hemolysin family protein, partial [Verrucomicrobiota bacterium]
MTPIGSSLGGLLAAEGLPPFQGDVEPAYVHLGWIALLFFFVLLNGFFVAAEFAIVRVRSSQLDEHLDRIAKERKGEHTRGLERKERAILRAKKVTSQLDAYLSATQLGITLASIALGVVVEPLFAVMLSPLFHLMGMSGPAIHTVSIFLSFSLVTFLHVVLGELIPKSLAITRALPIAVAVAGPLQWFYAIFRPAISLFNGTANLLLKRVFRIDPVSEGTPFHSADDLRILVNETGDSKEVTEIEREILINALELNDMTSRKIMLARNDVVCLDVNEDYATNFKIATESKHTRYPLIDGHLDHTLGLIHVKDLMRFGAEAKVRLQDIAKPMEPIPEQMPLDMLLKNFLENKAHMALVVDEYGGSLGIVTLDNVLEELVGDIQDEFDEEELEPDEFVR